MIHSNRPQLSVGICDTLWVGHPSPLPLPPADSIHMLSCPGMQALLGGKLHGKRCPLQNACPRAAGEGQPLSYGVGWGAPSCSALRPAGQGQPASAYNPPGLGSATWASGVRCRHFRHPYFSAQTPLKEQLHFSLADQYPMSGPQDPKADGPRNTPSSLTSLPGSSVSETMCTLFARPTLSCLCSLH